MLGAILSWQLFFFWHVLFLACFYAGPVVSRIASCLVFLVCSNLVLTVVLFSRSFAFLILWGGVLSVADESQ